MARRLLEEQVGAPLARRRHVAIARVTSAARRRQRRSRTALSVCLLLAVLAVGVGAWQLSSRGDAPAVDQPDVAPEESVRIYMDLQASDEQVAEVAAWLDSVPGIEQVTYLDQQASYEEFATLFADSPEMVASVVPGDLPTSFRFVVPEALGRRIAADATGLLGVKDVLLGGCESQRYGDLDCPS
jgi:cell division protein FtsX